METSIVDVVIGMQYGDEGKGKIVDVFTPKYDIIARFQGGPNAGHTLIFNGQKHVLHTIPSGIFHQGTKNIIGNGVIMDPYIFKQEIEKLKSNEDNNLVVNSNEFQLVREKIEKYIDKALNETDWNVLNILLKEPDITNKEIAEKAFMSVDGIGSSLRRMYVYFDIKESKYKKISLIMAAIKASN